MFAWLWFFYTNDLVSTNESLGLFPLVHGTLGYIVCSGGGNKIALSFTELFIGLVFSFLPSTLLAFPLLGRRMRECRIPFLYRIFSDPTKTMPVFSLDGSIFS